MSTSLRDQLLKAGLISKKQAEDAERKLDYQQRQSRRPPPAKPGARPPAGAARTPAPLPPSGPAAPRVPLAAPVNLAQSAKLLRDQALNRQQHERAEKRARIAAVRQMIEQHRLASALDGDPYHFVDGNKIRQISVDAALRARLIAGELRIVRYYGRYDIVPGDLIARLCERDDEVVVAGSADTKPIADAEAEYAGFAVPDDLIW